MGGAAKGMMHPYDDFDITFSEMANLIMSLSLGQLEASEKVDGVNIFWYKHEDGNPRFALNIGMVKARGITYEELSEKFKSHPASQQFISGAYAIKHRTQNGMCWLGPQTGQHWVNTEIISTDHPQTFKYDENSLVYHDYCIYDWQKKRMVSIANIYQRYWSRFLEKELKASKTNPWRLYHNLKVDIQPQPSANHVTEALISLDNIRKKYACGFNDKILTCYSRITYLQLIELGMSTSDAKKVTENVWSGGKHKILQIRKNYPDINRKRLDRISLSKNRLGYQGECKIEFRELFDKFGATIIEPLNSNLISDTSAQRKRLDDIIDFNIVQAGEVHVKSHRLVWNELLKHLDRFESLNVECPVMEGIVVKFAEKVYKFTGAFPSMNRVCGAARYNLGIEYQE